MSQKKSKHDSTGRKENEKKKSNQNNADDPKFRENVIRTLYDNFQDSFGLGLIASVAHTCQWDSKYYLILKLNSRADLKKKILPRLPQILPDLHCYLIFITSHLTLAFIAFIIVCSFTRAIAQKLIKTCATF